MPETKAIFVNEEAVRLLNYFISYKEIINKNEITPQTFSVTIQIPSKLSQNVNT